MASTRDDRSGFEGLLTRPSTLIERAAADAEDPRLADVVGQGWREGAQVALVGAPFDDGVRTGGGRVGAAGGPEAIRGQLCRYGTLHNLELDVSLAGLRIVD